MDENDMIIDDMDSFDFLSLDNEDIKGDVSEPISKPTSKPEEDDVSDFVTEEDDSEEETDELPEFDDEDSDENEDTEENDQDDSEGSQEPEEEEVDFETYEVTLPDGSTVVLSEAVQGYRNAQELKAEREEFETIRDQFVEQSQNLKKYFELAKLEADKVIEDYDGFDWAAYRKEDTAGYVENREFLDSYIARREEIVEAMREHESELARQEQAAFQEKARETGMILSKEIPGWNRDLYIELQKYAVENGADPEDIANSVDATTFKILFKAMQYEKGKQIAKAKVKKVGSPKKVAKSGSKPREQVDPAVANKRAIIKKMESGGLSESEMSDTFAFLED